MLLWPRYASLNGFIAPADDACLLTAAKARPERYPYADVIERPGFALALDAGLGRRIEYRKVNVTASMPDERPHDFATLLTLEASSLLRQRTRLDAQLWRYVVGYAVDADALPLGELLPAELHYGNLMAPTKLIER